MINFRKQEQKKKPLVILFENLIGGFQLNLLTGTQSRRTRIFVAQLKPEGIEARKMSRLFVAWKPVSGARVTGRVKMTEHRVWYQYINS